MGSLDFRWRYTWPDPRRRGVVAEPPYTPLHHVGIYIINIHENRGGVISFYRTIPSRANFASGRIYRFSRDSCRARGFWIISNKYISHLYNIYCIIRCKTLARGRGGNKTMSHAYKLCGASRRREQRAVNIFRHDEWGRSIRISCYKMYTVKTQKIIILLDYTRRLKKHSDVFFFHSSLFILKKNRCNVKFRSSCIVHRYTGNINIGTYACNRGRE